MSCLLSRHALVLLSALAVVAAGGPAAAQSGLPALGPDVITSTPAARLADALMRVENRGWIDRYLRADGAAPADVARRAAELIRKLAAARAALSPQQLLGAVDQVSHVAARSFSLATVMQLAVANDFRPDNATLAWDFGPRGGTPMTGFERVPPDDRRLTGEGIAALARDGANPLLAEGIAGVRKIVLEVPDGDYRVILMTRDIGLRALTNLPFGTQVKVNGIPLIVNGRGPSSWVQSALLGRRDLRSVGTGFRQVGGHLIGDLAAEVGALYRDQLGGALLIEGRATGGRIVIELVGFGEEQSYLTGLIAERADKVSNLLLSERAQRSVLPQTVRIALETEILVAAAEAVEGLAPAAGQVLETRDVVTPN